MEGCSAPLVVKFADTQKEKDAKRVQTLQTNLWNFAGINSPMAPSPVPVASPIHSNQQQHSSPYMAQDTIPATSLQLLQHLQAFGLQQQLLHGRKSHFTNAESTNLILFLIPYLAQAEPQNQHSAVAGLSAAAAAGLLGPISVQNLLTLAAMTQPQLTGTTASQQSPLHNGNAASLCKFVKLAQRFSQ
jgi:bruno